jgi:hypothetical protein
MLVSRAATYDDLPSATETITTSFHHDPLWAWAFSDPNRRAAQYRVWWGLLLRGGLRYDWVRVTDLCGSVALWIPPGGTELAEEDEPRVAPMLADLLGDRAPAVLELLDRFEGARTLTTCRTTTSASSARTTIIAGRGRGWRCSARTSRGSTRRARPPTSSRRTRRTWPGTKAWGSSASGSSPRPRAGPPSRRCGAILADGPAQIIASSWSAGSITSGTRSQKVLPCPFTLSTPSSPCMLSTRPRAMCSPNPTPPYARVAD